MPNAYLDSVFHMATRGSKTALNHLYSFFMTRANISIRQIIKNSSNYAGFPEDFHDYLDYLFFDAMNNYDRERCSILGYFDYMLTARLGPHVRTAVAEWMVKKDVVLFPVEDEADLVEEIPDEKNRSMCSDIAIKDFKLKIASPLRGLTRLERYKRKILLLQYAGYKNVEIAKKLNLTLPQLRTFLSKMDKDDELENLKLDLQ